MCNKSPKLRRDRTDSSSAGAPTRGPAVFRKREQLLPLIPKYASRNVRNRGAPSAGRLRRIFALILAVVHGPVWGAYRTSELLPELAFGQSVTNQLNHAH